MYQSINQIGPQTTEFFELREKKKEEDESASTRVAGATLPQLKNIGVKPLIDKP